MNDLLKRAFSPDEFEREAHRFMDIIVKQLKEDESKENEKTLERISPEKSLELWEKELANKDSISISELGEKIVQNSLNFHSSGYMGHQVSVTLPITSLTAALIAYLSHNATVYELGMAGTAMEKIVITHMAKKYGYADGATGVITSGGSLGNLTALVTARTSSGISEDDYGKLAVMVSVEAHYSVTRAASIMGIRKENIILIPSADDFRVRTDLLEQYYQEAKNQGKMVFCVVGCACSTAVGAYDDLEKIADFAESHGIWFHVDGAHGGPAIFSKKYKHYLKGVERSDSIVVDFHKMMMAPSLSTAVIYNSGNRKVNEFSPKAQYLWQDQISNEWYNASKHTFECTKPATVMHTYAIMRIYGEEIYEQYVDTLYDLGRKFAEMIKDTPNMELAVEPSTNIVCFRYVPDNDDIEEINKKISDELLEDGTFYIVNTTVRNKFYLRVSIMNPLTDEEDLKKLLKKITEIGDNCN